MPPSNNSESWREALKFINRCPICATSYKEEAARLFAKSETASLVHLTCPNCQSYFVAMIVVVGQGLSSVGMVTDLSFEDARRLYAAPAITTDELIEGYTELNNTFFLQSLLLKG